MRKLSDLSRAETSGQRPIRAWWARLGETDPPVSPLRLSGGEPWPKVRRFAPAFFTSTLLHTSILFFMWSVPLGILMAWFPGSPPSKKAKPLNVAVIEFRHLNLADYLPAIRPPGQAKAPGRGVKRTARPRLGSSHFDPRITIVSNPPNPDNTRVTLKTENAPPVLKLPLDIKLPDLISGGPGPVPEAAKLPTPAPPKVEKPAPEKPTEPPAPAPPPPVPVAIPKLPALVYAAAIPPPPPSLAMGVQIPDIAEPHLEVPLPPPPVKKPAPAPQKAAPPATAQAPAPSSGNKSEAAAGGGQAPVGGGPKILSLSVDPIPLKDLSAIPAGQLSGAFSIGPDGTRSGSPGGEPGGTPGVGEGGAGAGGDKSAAVGKGEGSPGGGGSGNSVGSSEASPAVSVSGPSGVAGLPAGTLPPLKPEDLVYPVKPETPKAHAPTMVVSSGAGGGGGLRIYGVLQSNRIYTVYFSMPGKSWILEYCVHGTPSPVNETTRYVQIHIEPPLVPPAPIEQFDFHRPPAPAEAANTPIVLHGNIREDGTVGDLTVVQGRDAASDDAAIAAFSRWKFRPAQRAEKPVAVEILIGIP